MKQGSPSKRDVVMLAEQNAQKHIEQVNKEKDDIMRKARSEALKEIKIYEEEMKRKNDEKITELLTMSSDLSKLEKDVQNDIQLVESLFKRNKETVIEYLIDHVKYVNIIVPEVVKGNFDEKFGNLN